MSQIPPLNSLTKGETYFVALTSGEAYQGLYRGFHPATRCHWFEPLPYAMSTNGPQWVPDSRISVAISLGKPERNTEFVAALSAILE